MHVKSQKYWGNMKKKFKTNKGCNKIQIRSKSGIKTIMISYEFIAGDLIK